MEHDLTGLLRAYTGGQDGADAELLDAVYPELRRIARRMLGRLRSGETLDTTALVHEAYLKLDGKQLGFQDRVHFFSLSARAMRQILIDHARSHQADKRGGDVHKVSLDRVELVVADSASASTEAATLLALDRSLERLESIDPRLVRVVECRFFAGMSEQEISAALNISVSTVQRSWVKARAWLHDRLVA